MAFFADKEIQTLVLINPDNPSGNYIQYADCIRLSAWCALKDIKLILDESFIDFSTEHPTFISNEILESHPNLIVMKSISKSYGVPGLRLGVMASADTQLMCAVRNKLSIWNINSFGEFFMQILGKYDKSYKQAMDDFRVERKRLVEQLRGISYLRVLPSEANYVLCEVKSEHSPRELAVRLLREDKILIKDCSSKCGAPFIRLAVRDARDNNRLIEGLKKL